MTDQESEHKEHVRNSPLRRIDAAYATADTLVSLLHSAQRAYDSLVPTVDNWLEGGDPFLAEKCGRAGAEDKKLVSTEVRRERLLGTIGRLRDMWQSADARALEAELPLIGDVLPLVPGARHLMTPLEKSWRSILDDHLYDMPSSRGPRSAVEMVARYVLRALHRIPSVTAAENGDWLCRLDKAFQPSDECRQFVESWRALGRMLEHDFCALRENLAKERKLTPAGWRARRAGEPTTLMPARLPNVNLTINAGDHSVTLRGKKIGLTRKSIRYLEALALVHPAAVSARALGTLLRFAVAKIRRTICMRAPEVLKLIVKNGSTSSYRFSQSVMPKVIGTALSENETLEVRKLAGHEGGQ